MLWKLSLTGIKSRFKDYAVLFSGLTLAAAIFYMFLTLALNPSFLKDSVSLGYETTQFVFSFGLVLLAIITLVYIIYANSFLLSMRKRDYGTYMMLGAKNRKISRFIFLEKRVNCIEATLLGIVIGIWLTQVISKLLISQLGLVIHHFVGFYFPAVLWTIIFFAILFFLAASWNSLKLTKSSLISLLHEDQQPVHIMRHKGLLLFKAIAGLVLLAVGYWAMSAVQMLNLTSIPLALITIVAGSYLIFASFFTATIDLLRKNSNYTFKGLHAFSLGQLKFRINAYNRILTIVSLLFALALGAITVGLNFNNLTAQNLESQYYDIVIPGDTKPYKAELKQLGVTDSKSFSFKNNNAHVYVSKDEIIRKGFKAKLFSVKNGQVHYTEITLNQKNFAKIYSTDFDTNLPHGYGEVTYVSDAKFKQVKAPTRTATVYKVADFLKNWKAISKLEKKTLNAKTERYWNGASPKVFNHQAAMTLASGFEFMGFFLGLAFLAMLASTLMFKVLSGASGDRPRYQMLWKIGTRTKLLKQSIAKEIGILFALPAALGIIDVLFGLQFFKLLLPDPYDKIWIPFTIFIVLYLLYYLLTVKLYEGIVLKKD